MQHWSITEIALMPDRSIRPPGESSATGDDRSASPSRVRVLIVEDEGLVAMNIEMGLSDAGFEVVGIVDTESDAIEAAIRLKPDAIIMDISLREGNGISAAREIQRSLDTRILFVTGNSDPVTLAAIAHVEHVAFVRKPFLTETLVQLVAAPLRRG